MCFGSLAHRWITRQIDSRTVEGTNRAQIAQWQQDYGEDSDWFRVLVRGEFPRGGFAQFIASDVVTACRSYKAQGYESLPKILGLDVARFGSDRTCLVLRQGRKLRILEKFRGADLVQTSNRLIEWIDREKPDAVVVDGDGLGSGVIDILRHRNYGKGLHEFHGSARAFEPDRYLNRRCEVWSLMREAMQASMEIPDDPELAADLEGPTYGYSPKQQIALESKDCMKSRGLQSSDLADAFAYTFAVSVRAQVKHLEWYEGMPGKRPWWLGPFNDNTWMS